MSREMEEARQIGKEIRGDEEALSWKAVKTEHLVEDEWIDFRRIDYELPDGKVCGPFYNYSRRSYVIIVPITEEGKLLCVRQFRHGIGEVTTEFPAGGIEINGTEGYLKGVRPDPQEALLAAKRELQEETGYVSDEWTHLMTVPSHATIADNYAFLYLAKNCRKVSGQSLDEMEFLNVRSLGVSELEELIARGGFQQAMHILAWELAGKV